MLKRESFFRPMVILYTNRHIFIKPNDEKSSILYFISSGYWHERLAYKNHHLKLKFGNVLKTNEFEVCENEKWRLS